MTAFASPFTLDKTPAYVINLDSRPERLAAFAAQIPITNPLIPGFEVRRFRALTPADLPPPSKHWTLPVGGFASFHSHLAVLKNAHQNNTGVFIFEDDAVLPHWFFPEAFSLIEAAPPGCAAVFGGIATNQQLPDHLTRHVFRPRLGQHIWCEANYYSAEAVRLLVPLAETFLRNHCMWFDQFLSYTYELINWVCPAHPFAYQDRGFSDNWGREATSTRHEPPISGWFTHDEGLAYQNLVFSLPPKSRIVEVGVAYGRSASFVAPRHVHANEGTIYLIDPFNGGPAHPCGRNPADHRRDFDWYMWRLGLHDHPRVQVWPTFSPAAAANFEDGSLDLVFIDADHTYEAVKADIRAWLPKIKSNGVICGHDYANPAWPGVKQAVDECLPPLNGVHGTFWHYRIP